MENVVAARRLRKSMLRDNGMAGLNVLDDITNMQAKSSSHMHAKTLDLELDDMTPKVKVGIKNKMMIKIFLSCVIVFSCLVGKLLFAEQILQNKYAKIVIDQYQKDYSKADICDKVEELSKAAYQGLKYVIPENTANTIASQYVQKVKPKLVDFDLKQTCLSVISPQKTVEQPVPEPVVEENKPEENQEATRNGRRRASRRSKARRC